MYVEHLGCQNKFVVGGHCGIYSHWSIKMSVSDLKIQAKQRVRRESSSEQKRAERSRFRLLTDYCMSTDARTDRALVWSASVFRASARVRVMHYGGGACSHTDDVGERLKIHLQRHTYGEMTISLRELWWRTRSGEIHYYSRSQLRWSMIIIILSQCTVVWECGGCFVLTWHVGRNCIGVFRKLRDHIEAGSSCTLGWIRIVGVNNYNNYKISPLGTWQSDCQAAVDKLILLLWLGVGRREVNKY